MRQNKIAENTPSFLVNLPMEIHFRIRDHLLRDPYTTINQLRILRLVCQLFDTIWFPVILNNIFLFKSDQTHHDRVKYLRSLLYGKSSTLSCKTLTLQDWDCLDTDIDCFVWDMKYERFNASCTFWRLVVPLYILASPALWLGKFPWRPQECSKDALDYIWSRYYASLLSRKAQFSQIRRVKITVIKYQSRWTVYHSTRILSALPQLTELDLCINSRFNLGCLSHITSLRTFRLVILSIMPASRISCLRSFIARNPYLTRFALISRYMRCNLAELLPEISSNKPLKLEHISLKAFCTNYRALIPHIQALSSLESPESAVCGYPALFAEFMKAKIFPPTITIQYLDFLYADVLFTFLRSHPGIISLSFLEISYLNTYINERLFSILAQHSETLRSLKIPSLPLAHALQLLSNEEIILRCANLQEIVFTCKSAEQMIHTPNIPVNRNEKEVFQIVARLDPSLTVGFQNILAFHASIEYCRTSDNPLVRDLGGRLFFLEE